MTFDPTDPVFGTWASASAVLAIKVMGQGWMTVYRLMKVQGGYASPEDLRPGLLNPTPDPRQLDHNDYVDRSRRMHRNDLENIPAFWIAGLIFAATGPALWLAQLLMWGFVAARAAHAVAYGTGQSHEIRATFYTIGSLIVIYMGLHALWVIAT